MTKKAKTPTKLSVYLQLTARVLLLLALTLMLLLVLDVLPVKPVAIATGSMEPTFAAGDLVLVNTAHDDLYEVGDIVQFRSENYTVVHRIVAREENSLGEMIYTTRGDHNNADDSPLREDAIIGKVIMILPKLGNLSLALHQ